MAGDGKNVDPDALLKKLFYVVTASVLAYAAVVYFFMLRTSV